MKITRYFSSRSQKKRRRQLDLKRGADFSGIDLENLGNLDPKAKEEIINESVRRGRSLNPGSPDQGNKKKPKPTGTKPVSWKNRGTYEPSQERIRKAKKVSKELAEAKKMKYLKRGAITTAATAGVIGTSIGIKKAIDNHKRDKFLNEYREKFKSFSILSNKERYYT